MKRIRRFIMSVAAGAGLAYFLDPNQGRARRARFKDQLGGKVRRASRQVERTRRRVEAESYGVAQKIAHPGIEQPDVDDLTLKSRVESELFGPEFPKGQVNINVVDGVVEVRGQLERPDQIRDVEKRLSKIAGVHGVNNLLHLPGQTAQNKAEAQRASREGLEGVSGIQNKTG